MYASIPINECQKLHPAQWVKVYGVVANRYDYIITCQVYQLEAVVGTNKTGWWDGFLLEPVDEEEQSISVEEALERGRYTLGEVRENDDRSQSTRQRQASLSSQPLPRSG